jgi:hypothetical protein
MLKRKLFGALKDTLSKFVYNFKEEMIEVGLLSGKIELKDLIIKPNPVNEIFSKMNSPIRLKAGMIALISLKVCKAL